MGLRNLRRRLHQERLSAIKRFEKHKRANLLSAPGVHEFVVVLDGLKPGFNIGSAFIFGNEGFGFSFCKKEFRKIKALRIPQFGKVESLNVSIAASIVMYEYIRQHASGVKTPSNLR